MQDATGKECGLHSGNVVESAAEQAKDDMRDLFQDNSVEAVSKQQLQDMMDGKRDRDTLVVMYAPWCQYSQVPTLPHNKCGGQPQSEHLCANHHACHAYSLGLSAVLTVLLVALPMLLHKLLIPDAGSMQGHAYQLLSASCYVCVTSTPLYVAGHGGVLCRSCKAVSGL